MEKKPNIIIIGPLGVGKSSIGRALAKRLKRNFYDTDREIEKRLGVDLSWIFDVEGEDGFRQREAAILAELANNENIVLSTGGGTILLEKNRKIIRERGNVIHLYTTIEQQLKRTYYNKHNRPSLRVDNVEGILQKMNQEREKLYQSIADFSISTNETSSKKVVDAIMEYLNS